MSAAPFDLASLAQELEALRVRLVDVARPDLDPHVEQALEGLRSGVEELRIAEEQLHAQNDVLARSQLSLELERARLANLFDEAPDAYLVTDEHGVIADANRAAERLFGTPREQLHGKPVAVFVPSAERREFRTRLRHAASAADPAPFVTLVERRGYARMHTECLVTPVRGSEGGELRWLLRDVTDRVQVERSLWELNAELERRVAERTAALDSQRAQLEELLRQMPVAVLIADRSGRKVRSVNNFALKLFGPAISDAKLGERPYSLRRPDGQAVPDDEMPGAVTARGGTPTLGTRYLLDLPGGETRAVDISTGPVRAGDGTLQGVIITVEDVSERERTERADREFVSNAAHQIRTPITAIMSAVAALQAGAKEEPVDRDRFLAHVERESERLARLADALLVLARVARGEALADVTVVPLRPLLRQLVDRFGGSITLRCADDAAAITNGPLIEQTLANVIDNAVKYADGAPVSISVDRRGSKVHVDVADEGPGMNDSQRERVLERFFRGSTNGSGFGLGLPIAAEAARSAGAELHIESALGLGTTVRLTARGARLDVSR